MNPARSKAQSRSARRLRALCVGAPSVYAVVGLLAIAARNYEVFPFFCWFLFPVTPNQVTRYALEVTSVNSAELVVPTPYEAWQGAGEQRNSMDLQVAVQALGKALESGEHAAVTALRQRIEANYLTETCSYQLVRMSYDPMLAWNGEANAGRELVGSYRCQ